MKTTNNQFLLAIVLLSTLVFALACTELSVDPEVSINGPGVIGNNKVKAYKPFSYTVDLTTQTTLNVEGINGTVNIQSVAGTNHVLISGEKIVSSNTYQDANYQLNNVTIEIDELTNELLIRTLQPQFSYGRTYVVNYTISVPSYLNVEVRNVNGEINGQVSVPLNGTVDMRLQNGSIELDIPQSTSADFSANLVNGSISLHDLTLHNRIATGKSLHGTLGDGQGIISLRTTNGNIDVMGY